MEYIYPLELPGPAPRQTEPADVWVLTKEVTEKGARLLVLPYPAAVESILNATFGAMGWTCRRYACGGTLYCSVGVFEPNTAQYVHKDAPAVNDYQGADKAKAQAASCFVGAAAHWGVCADVLALPEIVFTAAQVEIVPVADPNNAGRIRGYRLRPRLTVDKFARDPDGAIAMVQFKDQDGKVYVWPGQ